MDISFSPFFFQKNCHFLFTQILQFPLPHSRGSSHGQSRGIRTAYKEQFLAEMMADAFQQWKSLEEESGVKLFQ